MRAMILRALCDLDEKSRAAGDGGLVRELKGHTIRGAKVLRIAAA
jgi:hypothetical protein